MRDLARVHRLLLGGWVLQRVLGPWLPRGGRAAVWVDVGAGSGHAGHGLQARAASGGGRLTVVAVDRRLAHLAAGRRFGLGQPGVVAVAESLPFRGGAVEVAFSNLFFHHFDEAANQRIVTEMHRIAGVVAVVDLRGGAVTRVAARLLLPLLRLGQVAYHDGLISADCSYSIPAAVRVLREAGAAAGSYAVRRRFPCRLSAVWKGRPREGG